MELDAGLAKLIEALNKHLPRRSKFLADLLSEEEPTIVARDGNEYYIEKKELEFIAKYVESPEKFPIPVILEMCNVHGSTLVYVRNKMHIEFIKKAFGYNRISENALVLYPHEMGKIRRKLRTASQVMFTVAEL